MNHGDFVYRVGAPNDKVCVVEGRYTQYAELPYPTVLYQAGTMVYSSNAEGWYATPEAAVRAEMERVSSKYLAKVSALEALLKE